MKFLKKFLYFLLFIFFLICTFVLVCAFNPEITQTVAHFLYPNTPADISEQASPISVSENEIPEKELAILAPDLTSDYISPNQSELIIPENVSNKNGYQQIQDSGEEVSEEAALQLQSQLDTGFEGDGLTFDARFYPYYAMLSEPEKHLYRQIYSNANNLYDVFAPVENVMPSSLKNVFSAVYNDHPELFWLETAYAYKYMGDGKCIEISLLFNNTSQDLESSKAIFNDSANNIISNAQAMTNDYDKEKYVHKAIIDRASYNLGADMNQSAYSALINGQTVCAGYARAFQYILQQLQIPAYYCTGYAGESHAWNIVELDGEYYNVDPTWDDTPSVSYDFFNKTDDDFASTHVRQDLSIYLPPCNGQNYRNLEEKEPAPYESYKRSIEDLGFSEDQVLTDLTSYYEDCRSQIVKAGNGHYTFYNVVANSDLANLCIENYQNNAFVAGYMKSAAKEIKVSKWKILYEAQELAEGMYLMIHEVSFTK